MRIKPILILFVITLLQLPLEAQVLNYAVSFKDEVIGKMKAIKTIQGAKTNIIIESDIKVKKVISLDIYYKLESNFEKSKLMNSKILQTNNNRESVNSTTYWNGSNYLVTVSGNKSFLKEKTIDYNLTTLYYQEPINKKLIWSDAFGKFLPIRMTKKGFYELTLPDGRKNEYTYHKGICTKVVSEQMFSKIVFTLVKG